jgi:DNA-binding transcriptional ArsR family regulator
VTASNSPPPTDDLLTALGHPLRRRVLRELVTNGTASPRDLSTILSEPLSNVSYHVRVLANRGALELVRTRQVRGSTQHFYRATMAPEWARVALGVEVTKASNRRPRGEEVD